ncbi:MAG TPA: hypothetical protein VGR03_09690, partial [Candidatus Acidoferrum sp.]|nr:hypothetical protein [Candidatus Acidoferrum sp.]
AASLPGSSGSSSGPLTPAMVMKPTTVAPDTSHPTPAVSPYDTQIAADRSKLEEMSKPRPLWQQILRGAAATLPIVGPTMAYERNIKEKRRDQLISDIHNQQEMGLRKQDFDIQQGNLQANREATQAYREGILGTKKTPQERQAEVEKQNRDPNDPAMQNYILSGDSAFLVPPTGKRETPQEREADVIARHMDPKDPNVGNYILTGDASLLRPDKPAAPGSMDEQYLLALQSGDSKKAALIKQTMDANHPKQMTINPPSATGTWTLQEGPDGKSVLLNSKTGETKAAPEGVVPRGTAERIRAERDKTMAPVEGAIDYATSYLGNKVYTGSGDEALQEKFFDLAKPTSGFRMTQPQMQMLQDSRGWMGGVAARLRHATTGTWFSDEQRSQIVQTMKDLAAAKSKAFGGGGQTAPGANGQTAPRPAGIPDGYIHVQHTDGTTGWANPAAALKNKWTTIR